MIFSLHVFFWAALSCKTGELPGLNRKDVRAASCHEVGEATRLLTGLKHLPLGMLVAPLWMRFFGPTSSRDEVESVGIMEVRSVECTDDKSMARGPDRTRDFG
jgi:hypothetical protein